MNISSISEVAKPIAQSRFKSEQMRSLCLYLFMIYTPAALFFSFFPLYYKDIGYSEQMYGLQNALLPIVGMIGNYAVGYMSDKWARMKPIMLLLLAVIIGIIYLIFQTDQVWQVMGLVLLFQLLWVPVSNLTDSMAMLAAKRLDRAYATIRGFGAAGFACAALIIGWILDRWPGGATMSWIGMVTVGLTFLMLLPIHDPRRDAYGPEAGEANRVESKSAGKVKMSELWSYVFTRPFLMFVSTLVLYQMAGAFNDQYFSYRIREMQGSQLHIGMGWMLPAAIEVIIFLYIGRGTFKFRPLPMLALSSIIMAVRGFILAWTDSLVLVMVMQAVQGIAIALFFIYLAEYMMELIPDRFRASGQALLYLVMSIGATMTGSLIAAYVVGHYGLNVLFTFNGVLLIGAMVGFMIGSRLESRGNDIQKVE